MEHGTEAIHGRAGVDDPGTDGLHDAPGVVDTGASDGIKGPGTFAGIEVVDEESDDNPTALRERIAQEIGAEGEPVLASYPELLLRQQPRPP